MIIKMTLVMLVGTMMEMVMLAMSTSAPLRMAELDWVLGVKNMNYRHSAFKSTKRKKKNNAKDFLWNLEAFVEQSEIDFFPVCKRTDFFP